MNFKRLSLTDIKIDINRVPKKKTLVQAMETAGELGFKMHRYLILFPCIRVLPKIDVFM